MAEQELKVPSIEIRNYRLFEHLKIERFARVNLIVGDNNTGKTALLEAIRLVCSGSRVLPQVVAAMLHARDEFESAPAPRFVASIFHDPDSKEGAAISLPSAPLRIQRVEAALAGDKRMITVHRVNPGGVTPGSQEYSSSPDAWLIDGAPIQIPPGGLSRHQLASLWDRISLTSLEDEVLSAFDFFRPKIVRVSVRASESGIGRVAVARLEGRDTPVPMRLLGDGVNRLFGLALALVYSKNGVLLIDEIENGLHHSVQEEVWRFLVKNAQEMNVQIFATTHSSDALFAFQRATEDKPDLATLIRLAVRKGKVLVGQFGAEELKFAVEQEFEVR
ncbi:MAG: AAA family ATPase [Bryobacterales bacterium]|nr:AAA family ATPase [Bryobacterales bacterium]